MGQQEVIDFLSKHPNEWLSSKQIAEMMDTDPHKLHVNLQRLRKGNHILSMSKKQKKRTAKDLLTTVVNVVYSVEEGSIERADAKVMISGVHASMAIVRAELVNAKQCGKKPQIDFLKCH